MEFQVGQKVRVIAEESLFYRLEGKITKIWKDGVFPFEVAFTSNLLPSIPFNVNELEIVECK